MPRDHLDALRALFCHANLLDLSHALFARADLLNKLLACYEKNKDEDLTQRPIRGEMLELFATAS